MANKYVEARARATEKYHAKTYKKYAIALRKEEDAAIIADIEKSKQEGITITEYVRKLFEEKHSI